MSSVNMDENKENLLPRKNRPKDDPLATLAKPFTVPFANRREKTTNRLSRAATRKRINYDEQNLADKAQVDPESSRRRVPYKVRKKGAKDYIEEDDIAPVFPVFKPKNAETVLRRQFASPLTKPPPELEYRPPPALGMRQKIDFPPRPLHDPCGEFAIVLYDPSMDDEPDVEQIIQDLEKQEIAVDEARVVAGTDEELEVLQAMSLKTASSTQTTTQGTVESSDSALTNKRFRRNYKSLAEILGISKDKKEKKHPKVPVVIDPKLAKILRPHQVEGVKFLYQCVTGAVDKRAAGCIMADEMGLGKTLQCITLMWTLLRQSPQGNKGTISKAIVVCPASLVRNWANELTKWLGDAAPTPMAVDGKSVKPGELSVQLQQWANATGRQVVRPVLIISYETLRRNVSDLKDAEVGLMLCDEGHRLKNGDSLTFTALDSLNVQRRVILSGTPIQNDLSEYFALLSFANPGLLGTRQEFHKNFELHILRGREAGASDKQIEEGNKRLAELSLLVSKFIIRRTNDILSKYLPVKYEHVVFCGLTPFQKALYQHFIESDEIKSQIKGVGSQPLRVIGLLKKLCSHPDLLNLEVDIPGSKALFSEAGYMPRDPRSRDKEVKSWFSGKFVVLERMLAKIRAETNDKIVLISNYTQTLDMIERLCLQRKYGCLRLDGTLNISKRQKLVDQFNDPEGREFVFLLSSKAGGCGINLIGANRLILLDPDWNPASDQQALARVWRDGQKKDCFVYRFISTGTIEENIFQRQSMKQNLSSIVVDENEEVERIFSTDDLRKLFEFKTNTLSATHDTYKCKRCSDGKQKIRAPAMLYGDATSWNHFDRESLRKIEDLLLRQEAEFDLISFVFQYISH